MSDYDFQTLFMLLVTNQNNIVISRLGNLKEICVLVTSDRKNELIL